MESGVGATVLGPDSLIAALGQMRDWPGTVNSRQILPSSGSILHSRQVLPPAGSILHNRQVLPSTGSILHNHQVLPSTGSILHNHQVLPSTDSILPNRQVLPPAGSMLPSSTTYTFPSPLSVPSTSFTIRPDLHPPGQFTPLVLTAPPTGVVHSTAIGGRPANDQPVRIGRAPSRVGGKDGSVLLHINEIKDWNSQCAEENVEIYVMEKIEKTKPKPKQKPKISITDADYLFRRRRPRVKKTKVQKQFICHVCAHESKRQAELVTHLRIHTGEKPHHCPFCEKRFARQDYLNNHIRVHTGEKPFACPICQRSFAIKVNLNKHLLVHSSQKPLQCIQCPATFRRKSQLRHHSQTHEKGGFKSCPVCQKKLKGGIKRHMKLIHHEQIDPIIEESECIEEEVQVEVETDMDASHDVKESQCHCDHCGKTFNSRMELMEHIDDYLAFVRQENESESNRLENESGNYVVEQAVNDSEEVSHTVEVIETSDVIGCDGEQTEVEREISPVDTTEISILQDTFPVIELDQNLETASGLPFCDSQETIVIETEGGVKNLHGKAYANEIEVVVSPSVMAEVTDALRNQTSHLSAFNQTRVRSDSVDDENTSELPASELIYVLPAERRSYPPPPVPEMPYQCADCGLEFARKTNFTVHRRTHTGQKPYTCETCEKEFKDRTNYNRHVRIHTGEKPYKCEQCQATFSRNSHLQNHSRKHQNIREFICQDCGCDFNYYSALVNHAKTHTGETRLYQCQFCELMFTTTKQRGLHMKARHVELQCEQCAVAFTSLGNLNLHKRKHATHETREEDGSCDGMHGLDEILEYIDKRDQNKSDSETINDVSLTGNDVSLTGNDVSLTANDVSLTSTSV